MVIRRAAILISAAAIVVALAACTAVLGVEDVPAAPPRPDAGTSGSAGDGSVVTGDTGPSGNDLASSITALTTAYCTKYRECFRPSFDVNYKDFDECVSANAQTPTRNAALPGATASAGDYQGCATRVAALTCDAFNSNDAAAACSLKGSRKNGEKCLENLQCESGVCASTATKCRTCVPAKEKGADCTTDNTCGPGLLCNGSVCVTQSTLGQSCSATQPCIGNLVCSGGACIRQPDTAGATCDDTVGCALDRGLLCLNAQCISVIINGPGGECDYSPTAVGAQPKFCRRFAGCKSGKCDTPPNEGEPCGEFGSGKGFCLDPLSCQNGVCTKPPPSSFCE